VKLFLFVRRRGVESHLAFDDASTHSILDRGERRGRSSLKTVFNLPFRVRRRKEIREIARPAHTLQIFLVKRLARHDSRDEEKSGRPRLFREERD